MISCETLPDRIDLTSWFLKECSQQHSNQRIALDLQSSPVHIQLEEWLAQELDYYKQKQQLLLSPGVCGEGPERDFKLNFDLSVSQLAYLTRVLIETGVIQNRNTSQLIRFLVKFVKTKKYMLESMLLKFPIRRLQRRSIRQPHPFCTSQPMIVTTAIGETCGDVFKHF